VIVNVTYRRWKDGRIIMRSIEERELFKIAGDVLRCDRPKTKKPVAPPKAWRG
jgi:hypothetical protein